MEKIIVFGRGKYLKEKYDTLIKKYDIIAILDNSVDTKVFDEDYQCEVYNPTKWRELPVCEVICMSVRFFEMYKQLIELGFPVGRIRLATDMLPYFHYGEEVLSQNGYIEVKEDELLYYSDGKSYSISTEDEYKKLIRDILGKTDESVSFIQGCKLKPISRTWGGGEFGKPIDRVYIEEYLENNKVDIKGTVLEVEEDTYTRRYGGEQVKKSLIMHVNGANNALKINLETGEGVIENLADCFICTQTIQFIYDFKSAIKNVYKMLNPNGIALVTVPGICRTLPENICVWNDYWRFTKKNLKKFFEEDFANDNVTIESYGNVKTVMAFLYGLCAEQLDETDYLYNDDCYQLILAIRIKKVML